MSTDGLLIIDPEALEDTASALTAYIKDYKEMVNDTVSRLGINSEDWNDEDFNSLLSAISSFKSDIGEIEERVAALVERIERKIDLIAQLHSMKI